MVSFSRVSSVLCFGCHVVGSCSFGEPLLRDVTGKALLCSRCSVVLRHWHGPRLHKWLVFKVRVQRTGARWRAQLRGVSEMFKPCSRESEERRERAHSRVVLNCPSLGIAYRRLVQSERRYGAEPRLHDILARHFHVCDEKITFTHVLKLLSGLHIYNITTFVNLLIHTILQPFIKV